ncbi:MAG: M48 family metallopeptidase [bacterium]|nr:M48 family metallopeptidase [bacterium]
MALPTLYNQIDENKNKTWILIACFVALITFMIYVFSASRGIDGVGALGLVGISLIITGLISLGSYYWSDKMVLSISGAKEISSSDNPDLYHLVENLCIGAGIPVPKIYTIDDSSPNAFATGRDPKHASIAFTTGIIEKLERAELEGVAAHELSHVKNYDTLYTTIVVILVGMVALMADIFMRSLWYGGKGRRDDNSSAGSGGGALILIGIVFAILSPLIANLIKFAVSRQREYLADASAGLLTRNPDALASALIKISEDKDPLEVANKATAHLYIVNPLKDWTGKLNNYFQTHPPTEDRVARLRGLK